MNFDKEKLRCWAQKKLYFDLGNIKKNYSKLGISTLNGENIAIYYYIYAEFINVKYIKQYNVVKVNFGYK